MLVDLRPKKLTGRDAEVSLEHAGITCNKNGIPFDTEKSTVTSGVRVGSPAATSRGFGQAEFRQTGEMMAEVLEGLARNGADKNGAVEAAVRRKVGALCARFPVY
jgi:glycine hydroxymethyltransferase